MNKIKLAPWQLATGAAVFIALGNNATLFSALADNPEIHSLAGFGFVASIALLMIFVLDAIILAVGFGQLMKATIASLMVISAVFGYFSSELGIIFDPGMLSNMLETVRDHNAVEATELASLPLIRHVLFFGVAPALLLTFIELTPQPVLRNLGHRVLVLVGIAALFASVTLPNYHFVSFFARAHSCGTSTLFSVPCMFSIRDRETYNVDEAGFESNVLDILRSAGVSPVWIDNNSSCKGVCARIATVDLHENVDKLSPLYSDMGYFDGALIPEVDAYLGDTGPDTLIVLHMLGSHGPAYSRRYPREFEQFKPSCNNVSPAECTTDEIAYAYDNTILYTDFVLQQLIEKLQAHSADFDSFLFYASDHGESLGENGVYLHGLPYAIAPDAQTIVSFVFWASPGFRDARMSDAQLSHDNISHTLLGLYDVNASSYRKELDLFSG